LKFISHFNEFTWGVRTHTKQLNKSHTHTTKTKGTRIEVQSRSKLKKKKKKKKKEKWLDKTEGGRLGEMADNMGKQPARTAS